jgi:hypothetical protein
MASLTIAPSACPECRTPISTTYGRDLKCIDCYIADVEANQLTPAEALAQLRADYAHLFATTS